MTKVWAAIQAAIAAIPGGIAVILPAAAALVSRYGFHVSVTELTWVMTAVSAFVGSLVHYGVKTQVGQVIGSIKK